LFSTRSLIIIVLTLCIIMPGIAMADRVIAVVNDQKIMESELNEFTADVPAPFRASFKKQALKKIIDMKVFYDLGVKAGMLNSPIYKRKIARAKRIVVTDLFINRKLKSKIKISDQQAKRYYQHNKARFNKGKKILAGYIAVKSKDLAATLRKRIKRSSFETVTKSIKNNSENIRYFKPHWIERGKSRIPPRFENTAFELKKGGISPVIRTKMGYIIIKVFDIKQGKRTNFNQIKNKIKALLMKKQLERLKQEYIRAAHVKIIAKEFK